MSATPDTTESLSLLERETDKAWVGVKQNKKNKYEENKFRKE